MLRTFFTTLQLFFIVTNYSSIITSVVGLLTPTCRINAFRGSQRIYTDLSIRGSTNNEILLNIHGFRRAGRVAMMSENSGNENENLSGATNNGPTDKNLYSLNAKTTARKTVKKLLPLGAMLFFILFNYTILRDTKDVLVITAPNSGAEIIPFLKTYVNLPSAVMFSLVYSSLCNKMATDKVFYIVMSAFLSFFAAFAGVICKCQLRNLKYES